MVNFDSVPGKHVDVLRQNSLIVRSPVNLNNCSTLLGYQVGNNTRVITFCWQLVHVVDLPVIFLLDTVQVFTGDFLHQKAYDRDHSISINEAIQN